VRLREKETKPYGAFGGRERACQCVALPKQNSVLYRISLVEPFESILFGFVLLCWMGASYRSHSALGEGFN
jgi:hypothetical protein